MNFKYTHAIVSRIPKSICSIGQPQIDIYRAKKEFEQYVKLLRKIGLDVIELAAEETLPYSAFTGDIGIGVNGMAFLYNSKISQAKEQMEMKASYKYKILILPLDLINCLYINGSFMCSNDKEEDLKLIEEKLGFKQDLVDLTELSKLHGNLSRLVLLIGKQKIVK
ncbi:unnamed protein product [Gordionus sp. m RMFG-2023]